MADKVYTDQQMQWGAQIGYYNFTADDIELSAEVGYNSYFTIHNCMMKAEDSK